ncbi:MAG: thioredoxin domain-containing protein [Proteobacteria bacterium]|nr:thioredoxin domain-containing protein [Pseudomonadota bacterium]
MKLRAALAFSLAPALLLAACSKGEAPAAGGGAAAGEPVAAVAPPAGKAWADVVSPTPEGGMVMGNPKAPIKLIEYGSLSCPHCAKLAQDGAAALTEKYVNTGKVSWEFRSFAIHPQDVPLTMLVRCAPAEAFFPLVEQVYANFDALTQSTMEGAKALGDMSKVAPQARFTTMADMLGFTKFFSARGISQDQAHTCLTNAAMADKVAQDSDNWGKQGIESTPTLLINGGKTGVNTWAELEPLLQKAGAR